MEEIQQNVPEWRYLRKESLDVILSKLGDMGGTSYVPLLINHGSIINIINTKDKYCAIWCILARFHSAKTNVSLTSTYIKFFNTIRKDVIYFDDGLQIEDSPKLEKFGNLPIRVFEKDEKNYTPLII